MIPLERFYRHQILIERLEEIQSSIALLSESLTDYLSAGERVALDLAEAHLMSGMRALADAVAEVRARIQPELLEAQLEASIELINTSPERMRREQRVSSCCQAPLQMHWPCEKEQQCATCQACPVCESDGHHGEATAMREIDTRRRENRRKR